MSRLGVLPSAAITSLGFWQGKYYWRFFLPNATGVFVFFGLGIFYNEVLLDAVI